MTLVPEMEFELMQQDYSQSEEEFYAMEYERNIKTRVQEDSWSHGGPRCRSCETIIQVKVEAPQERITFRKAVVVVVALGKMKLGERCPSLFSDSDLAQIFTNIVEEGIVPMHTFEKTEMAESVYRYFASSVRQIADKEHKCLLLNQFSGKAQLVALQLQGENTERKVTLKMASYTPQQDSQKRPVTLAINGQTLYLSCLMVNGQPELQLEVVNENMLRSIKSELLRFLFYKVDKSNDTRMSTFESTACPGWFISTSQKENEIVAMTPAENHTAIQIFRLSTP